MTAIRGRVLGSGFVSTNRQPRTHVNAKKTPTKTAVETVTRRRVQGSMPDQIDGLQAGESVAFSERVTLSSMAGDPLKISTTLSRLRNVAHSTTARIVDELDARVFAIESATALNDSKDAVICVVNVCRTS